MSDISHVFKPGELLSYCINMSNPQLHQKVNITQIFEVVDMLIYWQDSTGPERLTFTSNLNYTLHWIYREVGITVTNIQFCDIEGFGKLYIL